jgi:hypothetical protein
MIVLVLAYLVSLITATKRFLHWSLSWARWIQSIPTHPIFLRFILIIFSHLHLYLACGLFPSGFPTKTLYALLFARRMLHVLPISSSLTLSLKLYSVKNASYEGTHYAVFSNLLLFHSPSVHIITSVPHSHAPPAYILPLIVRDHASHPYRLQVKL